MRTGFMKYRLNRVRRGAAAKFALAFPRWQGVLPAASTFERMEYRWEQGESETESEGGDRLMVFLPGIDDVAEDFERRGFVDEVRRHGIAAGAVAVDAHYGYYAARTLHNLISDDVIEPARSQGYRQVWMTGISLGGFGAASFAAAHPEKLAGLLLLAPYLGDARLIREIAAAGGVRNWEAGEIDAEDHARRLWAWLKREYATGQPRIPLYLGYGESDRFAEAHRLLAELIPGESVCAVPGGHDWRTWGKVWGNFMQRKDAMFG